MNDKFKYMTNDYPDVPTTPPQNWSNDFDYSRWGVNATVHLMNAPWGTSEVMVGNRAITGQGNVVKFDNNEKRDEWFAKQKDRTFEVMYRKFEQNYFDLPIPFDVAIMYNYIWVEFEPATSEDDLIEDEDLSGIRKVFYFIRDISSEHAAPNCTRFILLMDYWTTFINYIEFNGLILNRGHYPLSKMNAEKYLENPIQNSKYVTTPDIDAGNLLNINNAEKIILNNTEHNIKTVVAFSINIDSANWNTKVTADESSYHNGDYEYKWNLPSYLENREERTANYQLIAFNPDNFYSFLQMCHNRRINIKECIKAIYYVPNILLNLTQKLDIAGITCFRVRPDNIIINGIHLKTSYFGYDTKYKDLAKLYTFPYSAIQVSDFAKGNTYVLHTQGIKNRLDVEVLTCMLYNSNTIFAKVLGVGSGIDNVELKFNPVEHENVKNYYMQGKENELLFKFDIPSFSIQMSAYYNNLANVRWVNETLRMANDFNADMQYKLGKLYNANQKLVIQCNEDNVAALTDARDDIRDYNIAKIRRDVNADVQFTKDSYSSENKNVAAVSQANQGINSSLSVTSADQRKSEAISGFNLFGILPAITNEDTYAPQISSLENSLTEMTSNLTIANNERLRDASITQTNKKKSSAITALKDTTERTNSWHETTTKNNNDCLDAQRKNNLKYNYGGSDFDGGIIKTQMKVQDKIIRSRENQSKTESMRTFGRNDDASYFMTSPSGLKFSVLKMSEGDIARVGDTFLRYGYTYGQYVDNIDFNCMPKFSYWNCESITANYQIPDAFADRIKILLMNGVTIWRNPDDIMTTSIYDNIETSNLLNGGADDEV